MFFGQNKIQYTFLIHNTFLNLNAFFFKIIILNFRKINLLSCATFKVAFNRNNLMFIDTKILMKQPKLNIDCIQFKFL
jgi:hypothetical protein